VHLVNFTNPMMMKGPIRQLTPEGPQRVRLRLATDQKAERARLLVSAKKAGMRPRAVWWN